MYLICTHRTFKRYVQLPPAYVLPRLRIFLDEPDFSSLIHAKAITLRKSRSESNGHLFCVQCLTKIAQGWTAFYKLLLSLFKFLAPFLRAADLESASRDLYRGSLRLLLVLLHDFPEFLSEYYFTLCDVIPSRCIQLRNIILSAFPSNILLPDPHLRNVDFDSIPEMRVIPAILSDFASNLKTGDLKLYLDQYLLNRGSPSLLPSLRDRLCIADPSEGHMEVYDVSLINSMVMYIGVSSVAQAKARSGSSLFVSGDPGVVALQYLATNLDVEGTCSL